VSRHPVLPLSPLLSGVPSFFSSAVTARPANGPPILPAARLRYILASSSVERKNPFSFADNFVLINTRNGCRHPNGYFIETPFGVIVSSHFRNPWLSVAFCLPFSFVILCPRNVSTMTSDPKIHRVDPSEDAPFLPPYRAGTLWKSLL